MAFQNKIDFGWLKHQQKIKKKTWLYFQPQIKIFIKLEMSHFPLCKLVYCWKRREQKQTKLQVDSHTP